jgi:hypothetical protein
MKTSSPSFEFFSASAASREGCTRSAAASTWGRDEVSILADRFSQDTLHASSRKTQNAGFFTGLWAMMGGALGISTKFLAAETTKSALCLFQETGCRPGGFKRQGKRHP